MCPEMNALSCTVFLFHIPVHPQNLQPTFSGSGGVGGVEIELKLEVDQEETI